MAVNMHRKQTSVSQGFSGVLADVAFLTRPKATSMTSSITEQQLHSFMKAFVDGFIANNHGGGNVKLSVVTAFYDTTNNVIFDNLGIDIDVSSALTSVDVYTASMASILAYSATNSYGLSASDIIWSFGSTGAATRSFANPTRTLNSAFQISTTQDAIVNYTVDIAATISLTSGQAGTVTLQYADDSGFTTNVKTVQSSVNGNTGSLTLGLNLTQTATAALGGVIPTGKYVKIITANTTGTPTFTMRSAQEVLI